MYGSSLHRTYYGAGDYNRQLAMAQGYYSAGGFFSGLKKFASKAAGAVGAISKVPVLGGLVKSVPFVGTALSVFDAARSLGGVGKAIGGAVYSPLAKRMAQVGNPYQRQTAAAALGKQALQLPGGVFAEKPARKRRSKRRPSYRRRVRSRARKLGRGLKRRMYSRGDWGDDRGRDRHGHFLNAVGGHHNFRRRRRSRRGRRGGGGRVSFTTKDGRRVSFTPRGRRR